MGFPLPGTGRVGHELDRSRPAAVRLAPSHLSPVDRRSALPPHHPHRDAMSAFPYPLWSAGQPAEPAPRPPEVVELRGERLGVTVDLSRGGRVVGLQTASGLDLESMVVAVAEVDDVRGVGLRGGLELNTSPYPRSPWSLDAVHAAIGLPNRVGGDRLRWWELERTSGHLAQVDLHVPDGPARLVVLVRQTALEPGDLAPLPRLLIDEPRLPEPLSGRIGDVTWWVLPLEQDDDASGRGLDAMLEAVVAGMDDAVLRSCGRMISHGPGWAALELERLSAQGRPCPLDLMATPLTALEHVEIATRLRSAAEAQWLHLMTDEGLGVIDRVHPKDVGQPAGVAWAGLLARARRRESLGDWRVHLREGELAYLAGDLTEAEARWSWSSSLRPTAWADRNVALLQLARGRADLAGVAYLRAQRTQPDEVELGVEAVGALIEAGRAADARQVLDRMALSGHQASARHWLLEAEVALCCQRQDDAVDALGLATQCEDGAVHASWLTALRRALGR